MRLGKVASMKIAYINQPFDRIVPPNQSSVGICTYGLMKPLSKRFEVSVYGCKDRHRDVTDGCRDNVSFFFLPSTFQDRAFLKLRSQCTQLIGPRSPISTSDWLFPEYGKRVALALQKRGCDVVQIQQCSQWVPVIRTFNPDAKIVLHLHAPWFSQSDPKVLAARLQHVDLITTVSDFVSSRIRQAFPMIADRCETAYNGIDLDEFAAERDYRAAGKEKRILFVGAISPHSGVHVLLDAFRIVSDKFPDVRLDIIGPSGNYPIEEVFDLADSGSLQTVAPFYRRQYLSRLKAKLSQAPADTGTYLSLLKKQMPTGMAGKVSFPGPIGDRAELIKCYYNADVFAFPPVCDHGFGLPPLEAMAAGTPVVASRSGGLVETIADGHTGLLVAKNDAGALAEGILDLLQNDSLRTSMGRAARQRALTRFSWDRVAARLSNLYRDLCECDRPGASTTSRLWQQRTQNEPNRSS
jgi:glycosyltransferase involved in cell wall biosynthesis